jgi:peptide chain release factor 3
VAGEGLNPAALKGLDNGMLVEDIRQRPLILINNEWQLNWLRDRNPGVEFSLAPIDTLAV